MRMVNLPRTDIRTQYVQFKGGIDLATPVLSLTPGNALEAMNYEPGLHGGYKRIDGYERFDGRTAPSSVGYLYLEAVITSAPSLGATLTGGTSGASGRVVKVDAVAGIICLTKPTGTFVNGEQVLVGATVVGTLTAPPFDNGYRDTRNDAQATAAAADVYRLDIQAVPGQGPVRGVWMHKGVLYAFRDAVGGATCGMYKSSSTGWQAVALGEEVAFTNANVGVLEGGVVTMGGVSANITRVVVETGTLQSGTNSGRLILSGRAGGNFASGAATTVKGSTAGNLTLGGAQTAITLLPGGRYEFASANIGGGLSTYRMYGADGKNRAFEFDGTVFVPIKTGMALDAPSFLIVHKNRLFLSFGPSVQFSGDGDPYKWTVTLGAGEIGMGDNVTGFAVQAGDALAIFSRNSSNQLSGSTVNTFQMNPISPEVGALPYSVQTIGRTYAMDDRGIVATDRTQAFGNFVQSTISTKVQKLVDMLRARVVGSTVYRNRSQYRVVGSDGSGLIVTFGEQGPLGITRMQYPVNPTCFASCEDASGSDVVFFGADNGYVYQADRGSSFDGAPIEAYLRMPFNNVGGPRIRKRFRKAILEMTCSGYASIRFQPEFSYGDQDISTHRLQSADVDGAGGYWDSSQWDEFFYDARLVNSPEFSIEGTGLNMALVFYSSSVYEMDHTIQGMLVHFTPRRLQR